MIFCMRASATTPGLKRLGGTTNHRVRIKRQSDLLNGMVTNRSFKAATTPTRSLFALDDEEGDTWGKRSGAVYQCLENVSLGVLVVDLHNGRLHDGHVTRGLGSR